MTFHSWPILTGGIQQRVNLGREVRLSDLLFDAAEVMMVRPPTI